MGIVINTAALLLVAWIGFAAHRASPCAVKAVTEVLTSGTYGVLGAWSYTHYPRATAITTHSSSRPSALSIKK